MTERRSFTLGAEVAVKFLCGMIDLICRAYNMVEDGYEFFAKKHLITLLSAPNYCGEFDNGGTTLNVDKVFFIFQNLQRKEKLNARRSINISKGGSQSKQRNRCHFDSA